MAILGSGTLIREELYCTGQPAAQTSTSTSWTTFNINGTNYNGARASSSTNVLQFEKQSSNSYIILSASFPGYITPGSSGNGVRCQWSLDNSTYYIDALADGPNHRWGLMGYGGNAARITKLMWDSRQFDLQHGTNTTAHTGNWYCYFQRANWTTDTTYWITYAVGHLKYGTISIREYLA